MLFPFNDMSYSNRKIFLPRGKNTTNTQIVFKTENRKTMSLLLIMRIMVNKGWTLKTVFLKPEHIASQETSIVYREKLLLRIIKHSSQSKKPLPQKERKKERKQSTVASELQWDSP